MEDMTEDSAVLRAILEAAVDAIIVSDRAGTIVQVNPAAARLFQYDMAEMVGQKVNMLMPKAEASRHDNNITRYMTTGQKQIIGTGRDVEGQRKDKSVFPLHLSVGRAEIGDQILFIGILHDLSERRATEDALARSQRLDAIGLMTGGIMHDFNNLLTVIIGNLELLEMRSSDERHVPLIKEALGAAELGADLTSRLMVFARRSNLQPIKTDLRDLCAETLDLLKRTLGPKYRIKTDFADDLDAAMIDPAQLQSALMNLALNARDAMVDGGELLVTIRNITIDDAYMAQETDIEKGDYVRLSISDTGVGMSEEAQKRAFEPFFTTKSDSGGTGLGLAMVYGFVRQSGGHVTLYSELGHGTDFGLYFPAVPHDSPREDAKTRADRTPGSAPHGHGETILVVEDNPKVRKLSIARIRDLGFLTLEAGNGDEAYEMLKAGAKADLVFSDVVMPGELNGYDLAAKISLHFENIKVLLTSGYASDVVTSAMVHEGTYEILHKPYRQSELARRLQALLGSPLGGGTTWTSQANM